MEIGVLLEIMELAQNHVEEAHKQDTEYVIVLLLLMAEKLVLEVLPVGELAILTLVKVINFNFHYSISNLGRILDL